MKTQKPYTKKAGKASYVESDRHERPNARTRNKRQQYVEKSHKEQQKETYECRYQTETQNRTHAASLITGCGCTRYGWRAAHFFGFLPHDTIAPATPTSGANSVIFCTQHWRDYLNHVASLPKENGGLARAAFAPIRGSAQLPMIAPGNK